jgi:hypothetical protein
MFFVSNLLSSSQAGRRGFESRLPLHLFNNLHASPNRLLTPGGAPADRRLFGHDRQRARAQGDTCGLLAA